MILCVHVFGQTKKADVEVGLICWFVLAHVLTDEMYNAGTLLVRILSGAILSLLPPATFVSVFSSGPTVPERQPLEPSGADYHGSCSALGLLETLQGFEATL